MEWLWNAGFTPEWLYGFFFGWLLCLFSQSLVRWGYRYNRRSIERAADSHSRRNAGQFHL